MSKSPYEKATDSWLSDNERAFADILQSAGHLQASLRKLETTFSPRGQHMLDFLDITQVQLETSLAVCQKIMDGLGPTTQALRSEMEHRAALKKLAGSGFER